MKYIQFNYAEDGIEAFITMLLFNFLNVGRKTITKLKLQILYFVPLSPDNQREAYACLGMWYYFIQTLYFGGGGICNKIKTRRYDPINSYLNVLKIFSIKRNTVEKMWSFLNDVVNLISPGSRRG